MTSALPPAALPFAVRQEKPTILVVDDVTEVLDTLEDQLSGHLGRQFVIEKATSGEEALEVTDELVQRGRELAVVVADVLMPGMKGDELLVEIKRRSPDTVTIMLTGEASDPSRITNAINRAGLYRFIAKPWEISDMQLTVEEAGKSFVNRAIIQQQNRLLLTIHEASQVVARQRGLSDIARALLALIFEYAGAERVLLVLSAVPPAQVVAEARPGQPLKLTERPLTGAADLPVDFITAAIAAGERRQVPGLQPGDAALAGIASALVLPLINSGRTLGALYLEHRTQVGAFDTARVEALQLLAAQAAIALDNAYVNENLEALVHDRTQELLAVSSHKDEMVRIVSHDIRSPLSGISALAGLLGEGELSANPAEVRRYSEMIQTSTATVLKLVSDILDLAKLQSGTILLSRQPTDLGQFCERMARSYEPVMLAKQIQISAVVKEGLVAEVDEPKLTQIIGNLLTNAAKYSERGGRVSLTLDRTLEGGRVYARLRVVDAGLGIPAEMLPRAFERVGVKQRPGTAGEKGTGLGLSIVRELVQLHGGQISVESQQNVGTTFTILLPV